jgi:hypothetical protein
MTLLEDNPHENQFLFLFPGVYSVVAIKMTLRENNPPENQFLFLYPVVYSVVAIKQ